MSWTMMMLVLSAVALFWAGVAALAAFVVQLIVLSLTERRFRSLRWVTLAVPAAALACGTLAQSVIWLGAAISIFLGWRAAWLVHKRIRGGDRPPGPDPEEKTSNEKGHD